MKYRDMLGFPKKKEKKQVIPEEPKPSVTEVLKEEFGDTVNEGPAYEYAKYTKKIDKLYDAYWDSVKDFGRVLEKKGLRKQSKELYMKYRKQVSGFQQWFDKLMDSLQ